MAHYAILDENNIVTQVIVGRNEDEVVDGIRDWEAYYNAKRTSYNTQGGVHLLGGVPFRMNYAGIGYTYDPIDDAFIPPMPECGHDELLLNDSKVWECAACEAIALQSGTTA